MPTQNRLIHGNLWHRGSNHQMSDVRHGGQWGWHADYDGLLNATPHTSNLVICKVLSSPRGFNDLDNPQQWHASWKALFELHATSITGLNKTLQPNWSGVPIGGSGEELEVPVGMTREKSNISFTVNEKFGLPFTHMLENYNRLFIMDEDTKAPGIIYINEKNKGKPITDGLFDYYTWTMIFIEPDRYLAQANRTWLVTNMAPKTSAQQEGKRDKLSDHETLDIEIEMTGVTQVSHQVDAVGARILAQIRQTNADPLNAPAMYTEMQGDLDVPQGFQENMEKANREAIEPDT